MLKKISKTEGKNDRAKVTSRKNAFDALLSERMLAYEMFI